MKLSPNMLRVVHFPQVGSLKECFLVPVKDEEQAALIVNTLAAQHLWLEKKNVIPDYSNAIMVEMFEDGEWIDYYNHEEEMEWDEFEETYFPSSKIIYSQNN